MSKRSGQKEEERNIELEGLVQMVSVLSMVAHEKIDMAVGREKMREWWEGLTTEQKEQIATGLFEKVDRMRKISDAIHQEFASFSAAFRK